MRRLITTLFATLLLTLTLAGSVLGHVHGITPLGCMTHDPAVAGANGTNGTPADDANGGPIAGVIPISMGAPLVSGVDGGRHSALC